MIDITVVDNAVKLKREADAAYLVFKKEPTIENSARWTSANRAYTDFCVGVITELVKERIDSITQAEDIIANFDKYSKCKVCGSEILYRTDDEGFIASSDYVEGFPGWCYPCLVEHCTKQDCRTCSISKNYQTCKFAEVKHLLAQGDE